MPEQAMREQDLDHLLQQMRETAILPSADLMQRVMADALVHLPPPHKAQSHMAQPTAIKAAVPRRRGFGAWLGQLRAGFGGNGVLASLGMVAAVSVLVGYVDLGGVSAAVLSEDHSELLFGLFAPQTEPEALELFPVASYFLFDGGSDAQ